MILMLCAGGVTVVSGTRGLGVKRTLLRANDLIQNVPTPPQKKRSRIERKPAHSVEDMKGKENYQWGTYGPL